MGRSGRGVYRPASHSCGAPFAPDWHSQGDLFFRGAVLLGEIFFSAEKTVNWGEMFFPAEKRVDWEGRCVWRLPRGMRGERSEPRWAASSGARRGPMAREARKKDGEISKNPVTRNRKKIR